MAIFSWVAEIVFLPQILVAASFVSRYIPRLTSKEVNFHQRVTDLVRLIFK